MFFMQKPPSANYVIASPLEGVLMKDGKPLVNTTIIRRVRWNDNEDGVEETFATDEKGYFKLPKYEKELEMGALAQFVGKTDLWAVVDGERDQFWFSSKMEKEENSEYEEIPEGVVCDLLVEEEGVNINLGLCLTKCRWDNMPEEEDPNAL